MNKKNESSGYKGEAFELIRKFEVGVGDEIRITRKGETFEGILIPRIETADERHIVIKMKSGYNIGIRATPDTRIERTGKGTKPAFHSPSPPDQNKKLPKVAIISTGGTIASRVDYRTGAVRPALTAADLYSVVPELIDAANIETQILFSILSENMTPKHWTEIAEVVAKQIAQGADGVVVAHGTDTMGYTAAALSFAMQNLPVPVILVGSQRSADRPSSDAATNLLGAVTAAAKAPFAEVTVAFHDTLSDTEITIHRGTKVRKCHTSRRDTFRSINSEPLARVQGQEIAMLTNDYRKRSNANKLVLKPNFSEKAALIRFHPCLNPAIVDWYAGTGIKGLILEGTGLGHVGNHMFDAIRKAIGSGVIVAMTSQCIWGRVNMNVYDTGRDLLALGVIPLEDILAETALVKMLWVFGQTKDPAEALKLLQENISGEFSSRTLPEDLPN